MSGVQHTESCASMWLCTAGGEDMGGWQGLTQGDSVKLRDDEGSGAWQTGGGDLQGEAARTTSTASTGSSCSSTTVMDGSECTGMSVLASGTEAGFSCVETVSVCCEELPSGWASSESTTFAGEKHRETFPVSCLFWDVRGVPR